MLTLNVQVTDELWDEKKEIFIPPKYVKLKLEHSLISISNWESKWCKPFLSEDDKTAEEILDYIECMTISPNINPDVYSMLTEFEIQTIMEYINAPMTATTFSEKPKGKKNNEFITSELIYYWMVSFNIPVEECQKWHLNRLLTLIRICEIKNDPGKKMSKRETLENYASLNAARRKKYAKKH